MSEDENIKAFLYFCVGFSMFGFDYDWCEAEWLKKSDEEKRKFLK